MYHQKGSGNVSFILKKIKKENVSEKIKIAAVSLSQIYRSKIFVTY